MAGFWCAEAVWEGSTSLWLAPDAEGEELEGVALEAAGGGLLGAGVAVEAAGEALAAGRGRSLTS